jgi:regulator of sigma E protease
MIENQAMLNAGFKTGDKIIAADGEKIAKFDNDINIKIIKNVLIERNGTQETIKMPIDFIDQLSNLKSTSKHKNAVCNCGRFRGSVNTFRIKRFGSFLDGQKNKNILMRQKQFRQQQKQNDFSSCFKRKKPSSRFY